MTKPLEHKVPFDKKGNQLTRATRYDPEGSKLVSNFVFTGTLSVVGIHRGRSAAHFLLRDVETMKRYSMFLSDMLVLIQNGELVKGQLKGKWTFCKRGSNFGIKFVAK